MQDNFGCKFYCYTMSDFWHTTHFCCDTWFLIRNLWNLFRPLCIRVPVYVCVCVLFIIKPIDFCAVNDCDYGFVSFRTTCYFSSQLCNLINIILCYNRSWTEYCLKINFSVIRSIKTFISNVYKVLGSYEKKKSNRTTKTRYYHFFFFCCCLISKVFVEFWHPKILESSGWYSHLRNIFHFNFIHFVAT